MGALVPRHCDCDSLQAGRYSLGITGLDAEKDKLLVEEVVSHNLSVPFVSLPCVCGQILAARKTFRDPQRYNMLLHRHYNINSSKYKYKRYSE